MPDKNITSIADMVRELKKAINPNRGPAWCRGHANSSWKLQPHYDRFKAPIKETELLNKFRQNANLLLEHAPRSPFDFGWMFLMQHYGVPTRLLDGKSLGCFVLCNRGSERCQKRWRTLDTISVGTQPTFDEGKSLHPIF